MYVAHWRSVSASRSPTRWRLPAQAIGERCVCCVLTSTPASGVPVASAMRARSTSISGAVITAASTPQSTVLVAPSSSTSAVSSSGQP